MHRLTAIADSIDAKIIGNSDKLIVRPVALEQQNNRQDVIMWCSRKNAGRVRDVKHGTIICESVASEDIQADCTYLIVDNARRAFQQVMKTFFLTPSPKGISPTAYIGNNTRIGDDIYIGHHVVIEDGCVIGNNCYIDHNTVIKANTIIGDYVKIGCNTSIGSDGFGFEKNEDAVYELIPHVGNVIIENYAEIGDNVVIDKALMGSTIIGMHSKIDNLVYVAHGVTIGRNCLVIGGAVISGSTMVADNVWISPNATLMNKIQIGEGALIGLGAVVLKGVHPKTTIAGNPGRAIQTNQR